ncbi:hypothetical protein PHISCL_03414 [Aspergillus sclerotialis]|uniref:Uncharacterized protein n=1 Tax=Aspergillus sclerotialis TaxID=2070753 RepID=A0A3A2ZY48_9EURO|nr:hypothetical protein PHISCL_03414 [Aspergillus sclerotialis]
MSDIPPENPDLAADPEHPVEDPQASQGEPSSTPSPDLNQLLREAITDKNANAIDPSRTALSRLNPLPLTQEQNAQEVWRAQRNNIYENILHPYLMTKKPREIQDSEFRDLQTNILNSGQVFRFTDPRYRFFVTVNTKKGMELPFTLPELPPKYPSNPRSSLAHLLMKPIGIISDYAPAKTSKYGIKPRGGTTAFLKAQDKAGIYAGYQFTGDAGARIVESLIWFSKGYTTDALNSMAEAAHREFITAKTEADTSHKEELRRWGEQQRIWEWNLFRYARAYYGHLRWPVGLDPQGNISSPSREEIENLQY